MSDKGEWRAEGLAGAERRADAPPPYGNVSPWMAKTTTTRVTTTTTETHFFPLFRRKPQVEGRDKALPLPPPEGGDRNITRARSRDVTPTPPVPTVIPATPIQQSNPRFPPRDIRRIRSSESVREQDSRPTTAPIPRGRQTAMSSPSLATRTLSPPQPARQTILYTGSSRASQGWEREQGRLTWEAPPPPMITRDGRRPSAPAITIPKGKGKEVEPSPVPVPDPAKRSILGRRPSFWRKNRPKVPEPAVQPDKRSLEVPKAGPSRSSTSFEEPTPPRQSTSRPSTASRPSVHRLNSRPSTDKLSALARSNNSRQNLSRQSTDSPRHSVESRRSIDLSLPNVRPASPLFTEFGTYRASVDFAAAGGPSLMAALAERGLAERGRGDESVIMEDEPEPRTEPVPIPETHTPPRRRLTNNSSVGRGASWRRSLVESARSFIGGSNHSVDEVGLFGDGISGSPVRGSPVQTASSSPVPWAASTSTSPRASPGRAGTMPLAAVVGPASPPLAITTGSLRSRHGPPSVTSPTNTRVTFGDDPQRSRAGSITASIANWKSSDKDSNRGIRRARSTSRLAAAFTPSRKRSLSLFGQRPGSAGQVQTARERDKVQNSAPGHSHPSAFGPATEPALTLAPPVSYPFPSHPDTPVTNPATPLTGSQLSLGGGYTSSVGGSNVGHGSNTNVSGTPTAGASRTSSLLRSPLRPRSSTNPPLLRRLSGVFGSGSSVGMFSNRNGSEVGEFGGVAVVAKPAKTPARAEGDTPQVYLARLLESVSKSEVASAIASKNDAFHVAALGLYMERFNFVLDPLDIALRRLLMDLSLPKETQQIDRVMEAFAKRYADCNPGLFVTEDHAYVLAFSLMMLHTDAFNKSNKNKMTKADYVKNTRMPGVPPEILDCFFDNIVFAPFIFIEDATDVNGQRGFIETRGVTSPMPTNNSGTLLASKPRIDPYYMITQNLLDPLRVPIDQYVPPASPFSFTGTADNLDPVQLRRVFVSNTQLEIAGMGSEVVRIGVNKFGLLSRKDDLLEGGRRAGSRKWRRWAVVLTGSQLLFFREAAWSLLAPTSPGSQPSTEVSPQTSSLRPEEVIPLKDAVALYDVSYSKYPFVFRFILPSGRQQLIQAANEQDMNEWIARINYASALKSAGVRVRELAMNAEESRATGVAAAVSHARDQRRGKSATPPSVPSWSTEDLTLTDRPTLAKISEKLSNMSSEVELDAVVEPSDGGMKDTFDEVKAQLAATHNTLPRAGLAPPRQNGYRAMSLGGQRSSTSSPGASEEGLRSRMTTRAEVVTSKVRDLETKISTTQVLLQNELRIARNFAVLAPFQQTTRTRIRLAAESLARRIQVVRIDLAKMGCHRDVLAADLAAEEEEREQLRAIALEAAKEQLLLSVPRMTLSAPNDPVNEEPERRPSPAGSDASASPAWSMRSGTDYPEDPTLVANKRDTSLTTPETEAEQLSLSPPRKSEASLQPRPSFAASVSSRSGMSHMSSNCDTNGQSVEQANTSEAAVTEEETEEQAEIWHATRAGRRVSLVELPHPPEGRKLVELIRQRTHGSRVIGETTLNEPSS